MVTIKGGGELLLLFATETAIIRRRLHSMASGPHSLQLTGRTTPGHHVLPLASSVLVRSPSWHRVGETVSVSQ